MESRSIPCELLAVGLLKQRNEWLDFPNHRRNAGARHDGRLLPCSCSGAHDTSFGHVDRQGLAAVVLPHQLIETQQFACSVVLFRGEDAVVVGMGFNRVEVG